MMTSGLDHLIVNYIKAIDEKRYTRITIKAEHKGSFMSWDIDEFNYLGKPIMITGSNSADGVLFSGDKHLRYKDAILINSTNHYMFMMHISKHENLSDRMNTSNTTVEKMVIGILYLPEVYFWSSVFTY